MDYNPATTACFTGPLPRNLYGYERDKYVPIVEAFKSIVTHLHNENGYNTFITGGAQGIDQLAFWAVNRMKVDYFFPFNNVLFIPFNGQENRWRYEGLFSRSEYYYARMCATEVVYVSDPPNPADKKAVSTAMLKRNRAMVDASSLVIGVYSNDNWADGDRTDPGTAYTLRYGMEQGKRIMVLNPNNMTWKAWG